MMCKFWPFAKRVDPESCEASALEEDQHPSDRLTALPQCFASESSLLSKTTLVEASNLTTLTTHPDHEYSWENTRPVYEGASISSLLSDARCKLRNLVADFCSKTTTSTADHHEYTPPSCQQMTRAGIPSRSRSKPRPNLTVLITGKDPNATTNTSTRNWSWSRNEPFALSPLSPSRWSWTSADPHLPSTPRLRLCAMQSMANNSSGMRHMSTSWACLQVNQFDEILSRPIRLAPSSRRPMLKNQAFKPNLLPPDAVLGFGERGMSQTTLVGEQMGLESIKEDLGGEGMPCGG